MQIGHAATMRSKQMAHLATNKERINNPTRATEQINAKTARSTMRIRIQQNVKLNTVPDVKSRKRYRHPITELRAALCRISLVENLLNLVIGCQDDEWNTGVDNGVTRGTQTRLR